MKTSSAILKRMLTAWLGPGLLASAIMSAQANVTNCQPVRFLEAAWQDLLGRTINPEEKAVFLNTLHRGGTQAQVAAFVLNGTEYRTHFINKLYQQFLGHPVSSAEVNVLPNTLQQGATVEQLIATMVNSTEYYLQRGGTNNGFIEQLYQDLLGRPADAASLNALIGLLRQGGTRFQVAQLVLTSLEYRTRTMQGFFQTLLDRTATATELNFYLALWQQGARQEQLMAQIIGSAEHCERASRTPRRYPF